MSRHYLGIAILLCFGLLLFLLVSKDSNEATAQSVRPTLTPIPRPTLTPEVPTQRRPSSDHILSSIRGTAYEDKNGNARRDDGEPIFAGAWFKMTDGGNWYTCASVGMNGTFGIVVSPGVYYVIPVNLQGYRATTPRVKAFVNANTASLGNDIGYVKDANAQLEGCDLYHPARP